MGDQWRVYVFTVGALDQTVMKITVVVDKSNSVIRRIVALFAVFLHSAHYALVVCWYVMVRLC